MRNCIKCQEAKPLSDFYKKSGRKDGYMSYCKTCFNASTLERQHKNKQRAIAYLGGKCWICGYNRTFHSLDFHHIDPSEKEMVFNRGMTWERIKPELDKCALLCRNCHGELHAGLADLPRREDSNPRGTV